MSFPKPKDLPTPPSALEQTSQELTTMFTMSKEQEDKMFAEFDDILRTATTSPQLRERVMELNNSPDIPDGIKIFFSNKMVDELLKVFDYPVDQRFDHIKKAVERVKNELKQFIIRKGGRRRRSSRRKIRVRSSVGLTMKHK
jgi:hypothetical protein